MNIQIIFNYTIVLFVAVAFLSCNSTQEKNKPDKGYITTQDSVKLYYQKVGDSPQKVIIPGEFFLYGDFSHLSEGRTLVFYDMRNRGHSKSVYDRDKISIGHDIQDLEEVRKFFGFEKVGLIGYSYLGKMVMMYSIKYPQHLSRVVQMGPVPIKFGTEYPYYLTANDESPVIDQEALAELRKLRDQNFHLTNPREYCQEEWKVTRVRLIGDQDNLDKMGNSHCDMHNEWPTYLARHFSSHFTSMQKAEVPLKDIQELRIPVLTIHGTKDRNAPYGSGKEWAFHLPEARLITVEGAAHRAWIDAEELVFNSIDTFLNGQWPQTANEVEELGF